MIHFKLIPGAALPTWAIRQQPRLPPTPTPLYGVGVGPSFILKGHAISIPQNWSGAGKSNSPLWVGGPGHNRYTSPAKNQHSSCQRSRASHTHQAHVPASLTSRSSVPCVTRRDNATSKSWSGNSESDGDLMVPSHECTHYTIPRKSKRPGTFRSLAACSRIPRRLRVSGARLYWPPRPSLVRNGISVSLFCSVPTCTFDYKPNLNRKSR